MKPKAKPIRVKVIMVRKAKWLHKTHKPTTQAIMPIRKGL